jgi:hypothetical protein
VRLIAQSSPTRRLKWWTPSAGKPVRLERIDDAETAPDMEKTYLSFAFNQANGIKDAQCNKVFLPFRHRNHTGDFACGLIEGLDGSQSFFLAESFGLAQDSLIAIWIDIESKDLAAKHAMHNHAARTDRRPLPSLPERMYRGNETQSPEQPIPFLHVQNYVLPQGNVSIKIS